MSIKKKHRLNSYMNMDTGTDMDSVYIRGGVHIHVRVHVHVYVRVR